MAFDNKRNHQPNLLSSMNKKYKLLTVRIVEI